MRATAASSRPISSCGPLASTATDRSPDANRSTIFTVLFRRLRMRNASRMPEASATMMATAAAAERCSIASRGAAWTISAELPANRLARFSSCSMYSKERSWAALISSIFGLNMPSAGIRPADALSSGFSWLKTTLPAAVISSWSFSILRISAS